MRGYAAYGYGVVLKARFMPLRERCFHFLYGLSSKRLAPTFYLFYRTFSVYQALKVLFSGYQTLNVDASI